MTTNSYTENPNQEETTQTVDKLRFVVVSSFKPEGASVNDTLKQLLEREAQKNMSKRTLDNSG
jgi:ribosomal protein S16